jgi:DNA polymerase-3 subunit epsilon
MTLLNKQIFVCLDCETTGLDPQEDRIIEIAISRFTLDQILEEYDSLVNPLIPIPASSTQVHHITEAMVKDKPSIEHILPRVLDLTGDSIIVGHGITFDIEIIANACSRAHIAPTIRNNPAIDTLRLARLYGESPSNSLETLRSHFNIEEEGAHRAMSDVVVNIQVFKRLAKHFKTIEQLMKALSKPILMKKMPLGKHKGRLMKDLPLQYLNWAVHQDFDQDLLFSLRTEVNRRRKHPAFFDSVNPFHQL